MMLVAWLTKKLTILLLDVCKIEYYGYVDVDIDIVMYASFTWVDITFLILSSSCVCVFCHR